jgi:hypothetical protein
VAWVIAAVVFGVAVYFAIVVITVAPMERSVIGFFEDSWWQRRWGWDAVPATGCVVGGCWETGPAVGGFVVDIGHESYGG